MLPFITSLLFVPGDRPERVAKARMSEAELICVDLEDSVAPGTKEQARRAAVALAAERDERLAVRINRLASREGIADLHALADRPPRTLLLPMCADPAELRVARAALGEQVALVPLIETVAGLKSADAIAAMPGVGAIMFGGGDLSAELGVALAWEPLLTARSLLVMAAANAGVPAIDVPFIGLDDPDGLADECRKARMLGFRAKAAIHPAQLGAIHQAFRPSEAEREEARAALRAFEEGGGGAVRWQGRMLESPFIPALKRIAGVDSHA